MLIIFGIIILGTLLASWIMERREKSKQTKEAICAFQAASRKKYKYYGRSF